MARSTLVLSLLVALVVPAWSGALPAVPLDGLEAQAQLNSGLALSLARDVHPGADLAGALDAATRAIASRELLVAGDTEGERILRAALAREERNLASADAVRAILEGPGTKREKAFDLLDEGLASRPRVLGTTSPRLLGYFDAQRETAGVIEELADRPTLDAFEVAARATGLQAAQLDIDVRVPSIAWHDTPSDALAAYARARGIAVTPEMREVWTQLDALQPSTAAALTNVVDAFVAYEDATAQAFAEGDPAALARYADAEGVEVDEAAAHASERAPAEDWNVLASAGVDLGPVLGARAILLERMAALRHAVASAPPAPSIACAPIVLPEGAEIHSVSIDATACDNLYSTSARLLVDLGGDDRYLNNAGGNRLTVPGGCDEPVVPNASDPAGFSFDPARGNAAALFDVGGNDVHAGPICGVNGGASLGAGLLVNVGGDDLYGTAGPEPNNLRPAPDSITGTGVNGGGHIGVGMLLDTEGADRYEGDGSYAINGGSLAGLGALIDAGSANDVYEAKFGGVNGGANIGAAFLYDAGGDDTYTGEGRVANGGAVFGAGVLVDLAGDDRYQASTLSKPRYSMAQNGGAKFGVALLYDGSGDDTYLGLRDGANGGGVDGLGTLIDVSGDDRHEASYNGTIGSGWSLVPDGFHQPPVAALIEATITAGVGVGMLLDMDGHDLYRGSMFATVGGAYLGASFFVDAAGNDEYRALDGGGAIGGAGGHNKGAGVAFLFDGAGDDAYVQESVEVDRSLHGVAIEFGGKGANGGAAMPGGVALLVDAAGNDIYRATSSGVNGGAAIGAVGMLLDVAGDDTYEARDRGTNGGAYGGSKVGGALGGDDRLPAIGFLLDLAGDDSYVGGSVGEFLPDGSFDPERSSPGSGVNGGADHAIGFLLDAGGRDAYTAMGTAANGGAARGIGLLLDLGLFGDDAYRATASPHVAGTRFGQNGGIVQVACEWARSLCPAGSVGLLLDAGGTDDYHDDDSPYLGRGTDVCVSPKYDDVESGPGRGQELDLSPANWARAPRQCFSATS